MKILLENWKEYLTESPTHYHMLISIKAEPDTKMYGSIFNKIRAIPGVTIVKTAHASEKDSRGNKIVTLDLKFFIEPGQGEEYVGYIKAQLQRLKDNEGDRILGVRVTRWPEKID
tara:strand:+ start:3459 stop:3803 length:345 start_codon:yes stop_codon:yes gene_type:complete